MTLVRKTYEAPACLTQADLDPLRDLVGDGAVDYALVIGAFHFINRIADLLHVDPEALPAALRRIEPLRRLIVWASSFLLAKMDLKNRADATSYEEAVARIAPGFERATGCPLGNLLESLRTRPKVIEVLHHALEERDVRSSLARNTIAGVQCTVERALPHGLEETQGLHRRPSDPVEAFAFVGTRYAYRATEGMVDALRDVGYDDLGILDLAIAVADANQWARLHRLLGLAPDLFYLFQGESRDVVRVDARSRASSASEP